MPLTGVSSTGKTQLKNPNRSALENKREEITKYLQSILKLRFIFSIRTTEKYLLNRYTK